MRDYPHYPENLRGNTDQKLSRFHACPCQMLLLGYFSYLSALLAKETGSGIEHGSSGRSRNPCRQGHSAAQVDKKSINHLKKIFHLAGLRCGVMLADVRLVVFRRPPFLFEPCVHNSILGSRFDEVSVTVARTAPGGEDAKQRMEICTASFVCKMICTIKMSQNVEGVEHSAKKILAECSTLWPSAQDFRSIIQPNYQVSTRK